MVVFSQEFFKVFVVGVVTSIEKKLEINGILGEKNGLFKNKSVLKTTLKNRWKVVP